MTALPAITSSGPAPRIDRATSERLARRARLLSWLSVARSRDRPGGQGLLIGGVAVEEGLEAWRGEGCCVSSPLDGAGFCEDDCCAS